MNKVAQWIIWIHWWNNDNLNYTLRLQVGKCEWVSSRIINSATTPNHFDLVLKLLERIKIIKKRKKFKRKMQYDLHAERNAPCNLWRVSSKRRTETFWTMVQIEILKAKEIIQNQERNMHYFDILQLKCIKCIDESI